MGILKFAAKAAGTVVLTATGIASAVGEAVIGAVAGNELAEDLSGLLGQGKAASFNGIRNMWSDEHIDAVIDKVDNVNGVALMKKQMASTARQMADQARKNGDMEKYNEYMERYKEYREEYKMMTTVEDDEE